MINYIIVEATSAFHLQLYVNDKIEIGYVPQGGVNVTTPTRPGGDHRYTQALTKQD